MNNKIYVSICCDRHIDEVVRVFDTKDKAIKFCKDFIPDGYDCENVELIESMKREKWIYCARYGCEGDSVRVEERVINET